MNTYQRSLILLAAVALCGCSIKQTAQTGAPAGKPQTPPSNQAPNHPDGDNGQPLSAEKTEGTITSGGGDYLALIDGAAWFAGPQRAIQVCYEVSPDFGVASEELEHAITFGFNTWGQYIEQKGIQQAYAKHNAQLATKYNILSRCNGDQDLTIYFGVMTDEVREAKKLFSAPFAFAHATQMSSEGKWGKGFIWFSPSGAVDPVQVFPNWKIADALSGMMLHELGHVYGCDHVEGTIMAISIPMTLTMADNSTTPLGRAANIQLTRIDGTKELVPAVGMQRYSGEIRAKDASWLLGRSSATSVGATLIQTSSHSYNLEITDNGQLVVLGVTLLPGSDMSFETGARAFNVEADNGQISRSAGKGIVAIGTIQTKDGSVKPVIFSQNSSYAPVVLQVSDGIELVPFFASNIK